MYEQKEGPTKKPADPNIKMKKKKKNGPGGAIAMAGAAPIKKQINKNTNK